MAREKVKPGKTRTSVGLVEGTESSALVARTRSPLKFFLLVFALSAPFVPAGALTARQLLPGLPLSALMFVCPALAASILVYEESKTAGAIELLKRSFDYKRTKARAWFLPAVLLMPCVTVMAYGLMRVLELPLPTPQILVVRALALPLPLFIAALGEELGWSGYITDPLQDRWNALGAGIVLGIVWAVWHCVPLLQVHRPTAWIAWWSLYTVASRVLIVWIYNNTGKSVFAATLYHTSMNMSWLLFPNHGSHWAPHITGLIVAFAAGVVTFVWGPGTLAGRGGR